MWRWRLRPPWNLSKKGFAGITPEIDRTRNSRDALAGTVSSYSSHSSWPEIVLDVAHNPAGAWALRSALSSRYDDRPLIFVFGAMRDKAICRDDRDSVSARRTGHRYAAGESAGGIAGGNSRAAKRTERRSRRLPEVKAAVGPGARLRGAGAMVSGDGLDLPGGRGYADPWDESVRTLSRIFPRIELCRN